MRPHDHPCRFMPVSLSLAVIIYRFYGLSLSYTLLFISFVNYL
jgi:hypothetical protein